MSINPNLPRSDALLLLCEVAQLSAATVSDIQSLLLSGNPDDEAQSLRDLHESLSLLMSAARQLQKKVGDAITALEFQ